MNKKILALVLTAAISFSSAITAFAADTSTNISLNDKSKFSVTLQSNSLVFNNEPTDREYDSITLDISTITGTVVGKTTYDRGQGNGTTIDLAGIPDGSYLVRVGYVTNGFKQYTDRYAYNLDVKNGVGSFKTLSFYANNLKALANERTDAAALTAYKVLPSAAYITQANLITAGITNEYDKVKAIHDWVADNVYYDFSDLTTIKGADSEAELFPGGPMKRGLCGVYAGVTTDLMQAAGFPAKTMSGNVIDGGAPIGHEWTEVFVDGRWIFMDTTLDSKNSFIYGKFSNQIKCTQTYFDTSVAEWSTTHQLDGLSVTDQDKKVENFTTVRVDSVAINKKTNSFTVKFDSQGGSAVDSVNVARGAGGSGKVPVPATPTKAGYTFVGWVVSNPHNSALWKFDTNVVSYDVTMYAKWQAN